MNVLETRTSASVRRMARLWGGVQFHGAPAAASSYAWMIAEAPAGRLLDVGCGDGALREVVAATHAWVGLDPDVSRDAPAEWVRGEAQALPFAAAQFDVVAAHLVLPLLQAPPQVLHEMARVLRPGGELRAVLGGGPCWAPGDYYSALITCGAQQLGARFVSVTGDARWRSVAWLTGALAAAGFAQVMWARGEAIWEGPAHQVGQALMANYEFDQATDAERGALLADAAVRCGVHPDTWVRTVSPLWRLTACRGEG